MSFFRKHTNEIIAVLVSALTISTLLCAISLWQSTYSLSISRYSVYSDKLEHGVRIVLLSDMHSRQFGDDNRELLETVTGQAPDAICFVGDIMDYASGDLTAAESVIRKLSKIAPVYVCIGNNEYEYINSTGTDVIAAYKRAGALVAEGVSFDTKLNGQALRIGGIWGYCLPDKFLEFGTASPEETEYLRNFTDTDLYTVLLCHMPYTWLVQNGLNEWNIDCVLSGHLHGGQIRLPLIGGLYAPDQGLFPGRVQGVYLSDDGERALVLTRGLGSTKGIPRLNNLPEVLVLDLLPADE